MTHSLRCSRLLAAASFSLAVLAVGGAHAQAPGADAARDALPGKDVFDAHCAVCHLHPETSRAVPVSDLRTYPADRIKTALTSGVMRAQGASLSDEEVDQVVAYLAAAPGAASPGAPATSTTTSTTTTTSSHSSTTAPVPKS